MSDLIAPADEGGLAAAIAAAHAAREPVAIEGNGSKRGLLRPVQAARTVSTRNLSGITLYRPAELVLSARAGTPIPQIEAALAEKGQHLIAEPPDTRAIFGSDQPATLGGIVAANLSGPRRITWGAMRDHVLGIRFVNGTGEVLRSGGRVLKNVTGLDLCKLLAGSYGTLGVMTEITLKVLPAPEATATLLVAVPDAAAGVRALSAGLGSPFGVSGAALVPGEPLLAALRIEDFAPSVTYRIGRLREALAGFGDLAAIEGEASRTFWREVRDAAPLAARPEEAVWRVSVRPSAGPGVAAAADALGGRALLDWGGGLVWAAAPATEAAHAAIVAAAGTSGGTCTLFRAPEALRMAVAVLPEEPAPLAAIGRRVKATLDPAGILNPGRMRAGA
ncbi:glycolate oxidase subunit GlcE [Neoroseomonas oryzicola]|uniref:Glycolate oxidase subunit GlcE n=1 Tax=Neoroseomonas oryzicola TaxID=535904 RepID=A0A9X9WGB3_9PROT|nr:glycolate oxidase subunit GlcE [Neoroseomonas oryzicola]MBR0659373.1 glycolate oxidase subunit GlcE [Neoroseomonas oryzicola]NKE16274.1 glycolate oxidase subunit GlcE [Neoroseomonas oryzicola]